MKKILVLAALAVCMSANAQTKGSQKLDDKTLDSIIQRLEKTGKLDEAVNRVISNRIVAQKEEQARLALEQEKKNQENAKLIAKFNDTDHYRGDKNARYSIIVYEDMECPFCQMFAEVPEKAIAKLNDVNYVSRANPLQFHMPMAAKEAVLAECISSELGNDGYFAFTRNVFRNTLKNGQGLPQLSNDYVFKGTEKDKELFNKQSINDKPLFVAAKDAGVKNFEQLVTCYRDPSVSMKLQNMLGESLKYGITGTPMVVLKDNVTNKSAMYPGVVSEEELIQRVNQFIAQ